MIKNLARYLAFLPTVIRKAAVLHRHSVFLDEATPEQLNKSLRAWRLFKREHGYLRSLVEQQCVDAQGMPIPWYTYPAIEQLSKWDFSKCDVLEYGSGNSTLWWAERARTVTSIESSPEWYRSVRSRAPKNCDVILAPVETDRPNAEQVQQYVNIVDSVGAFDVVVIDGVNLPSLRRRCVERSLSHFRTGGLLIVDNSDWLPLTCRDLRDRGFFEIDFCGLGPLNDFAETTSIFFRDDLGIRPRGETHPGHSVGGYLWNLDESDPGNA